MDMIYKDDTLFVDLIGIVGIKEVDVMKERVFSILNQYEVDNIVINLRNAFKINKNMMNSFINEYHKKYKGSILIDK
jgi:UTP:GlnB (protein PII) uridylyltransferase